MATSQRLTGLVRFDCITAVGLAQRKKTQSGPIVTVERIEKVIEAASASPDLLSSEDVAARSKSLAHKRQKLDEAIGGARKPWRNSAYWKPRRPLPLTTFPLESKLQRWHFERETAKRKREQQLVRMTLDFFFFLIVFRHAPFLTD